MSRGTTAGDIEPTTGVDRGAVRCATTHYVHFAGGTNRHAIHDGIIGKQVVVRTEINA